MKSDRTMYIILGLMAVAVLFLMFNGSSESTFGVGNYEFARIIWMICAVIGLGWLGRAWIGPQSLVHIAAWLAIIVGLVVGYKIYHGEPIFGAEPPAAAPISPDSGTGISARLEGYVIEVGRRA